MLITMKAELCILLLKTAPKKKKKVNKSKPQVDTVSKRLTWMDQGICGSHYSHAIRELDDRRRAREKSMQ